MVLDKEIELFEKHREEWVARHRGKFVLIKGEEVVGFFESAETAFENGVDRWGNEPMLIKQVLPSDPVAQVPSLRFGFIHVHPQLELQCSS